MSDEPVRWIWGNLLKVHEQQGVARHDDRRVGDLAMLKGWITSAQLDKALHEQERLHSEGKDEFLDSILVRRNWLTPEQRNDLRRLLEHPSDSGPTESPPLVAPPAPAGSGLTRVAPVGGKRVGRYEIGGELGRGGMSVVFRARDTGLKRDVALKVLADSKGAHRLQREAEAIARLRHPHIVAVYDVGTHEEMAYLAMELVEGRSLTKAWTEWPLQKKVTSLEEIARAVAYAHEAGVVHRDLKPTNVMVTAADEVKVMDFGIALVQDERRLTVTGTVMGTPAYMSPEQVRGERAGPTSDVYALGVMLYEAITGEVPFVGTQLHEVYQKILTREPVRPRTIHPSVAADLETICLKALEKNPKDRYSTAAAFAEDLERWRNGDPIRGRPLAFPARLRRTVARHPVAAAVIVTLLAAALPIAMLARLGVRGGTGPPPQPSAPEYVIVGEPIEAGNAVSKLNDQVRRHGLVLEREQVFNEGGTPFISLTPLDSRRFVAAYRDDADQGKGTVAIGTMQDGAITFGPEMVFNPVATDWVAACALDASTIVVAYADSEEGSNETGATWKGTALVGTVAGDGSVSFGPECVFSAHPVREIAVSSLGSDGVALAFATADEKRRGRAVIGRRSSDLLLFGTAKEFSGSVTESVAVAPLGSSRIFIAFSDVGEGGHGIAMTGETTGTDLTLLPESRNAFTLSVVRDISVRSLSADRVAVAFCDLGASQRGTLVICEARGRGFAGGYAYPFGTGGARNISVTTLDADTFAIGYKDLENSGYGTLVLGSVSALSAVFTPPIVFKPADTQNVSVAALGPAALIAAYADNGRQGSGTVRGGTIPPVFGIAGKAGSPGDRIPVITEGVSNVHSDLVPDAVYYSLGGTLVTSPTPFRVGTAVSTTRLGLERR